MFPHPVRAMERTMLALLGHILLLLLLLLLPKPALSQQLRAMCIPQFALANQACSILPMGESDSPHTVSSLIVTPQVDDDEDGDDDTGDTDNQPEHHSDNGHHHGHGHGHRHRHRHDHGDDGHNHETRASRDCCRWLKEVEPGCVCEALLHLPVFLIKPKHIYTISIDDSCKIEYKCGGV